MEGGAYGQKDSFLCALGCGQRHGALDSSFVPGDYDLLGRVHVGCFADFSLSRLAANLTYLFRFHAENCGHRADTRGHSLLHVAATVPDRAHGIGKAQGSRGHMR